jgi:hypothetical protein
MASFRIFGPYYLDLGDPGLAPGEAQATYWFGWQPQPTSFTVTVTAHPSTLLPGGSGSEHASQALQVSETSVEWVPNVHGDVVDLTLYIHATLVNSGSTAIRSLSLFITFVEL